MRKLSSLFFALLLLATPARADQNTVTPIPGAPLTMTSLATFLNQAHLTMSSCFSGASAPAVFSGAAKTYQCWVNTTSTTPASINIYDGAAWVQTGVLDTTTHLYSPAGAAPTFTTSITSPLYIGGTAVGSTLTLKSTSGVGSTDAIIFQVGNNGATEAMRFPTGGQVLVGSTSAIDYGSLIPRFQLHATTGTASILWQARWSNDATGSAISFSKSRGTTVGSFTIVQSGDTIGTIAFRGTNGTTVSNAAAILAEVDGTPGASNDMPGRLVFQTTPDGSGTLTESFRVTNAQQVKVATATDSTTSTTGSVITAGGLGVAKALFVGTTANIIGMASAATTSAVCYNTGTGLLTYNSTVGTCTVSTIAAKDLRGVLGPQEGLDIVMAMEPWRYTLRAGPSWVPGEQIGFVAEYTTDDRMVARNPDGTAGGFRYEQYTAALTAAVQWLKADNDNLRAAVQELKRRIP